MEHQDNTELLIAKGDAAKALLRTEAFQAVCNEMVSGYMTALMQSKPDDASLRERMYIAAQVVQEIAGTLNQWVLTGTQARMSLEAQAEQE